jgi:hypothetical protein
VAKVKLSITKEDIDQAEKDLGDFVVPTPGYYILELKECNSGYSKKEDGTEDKARARLECIWTIIGVGTEGNPVEENYGNIWDYVSLSETAGWKRTQFLDALGIKIKPGTHTINTDEYIGRKALGRLRRQAGRNPGDEPRAKIAKLSVYADQDFNDAFGSITDDGESEYVTAEGLAEMDLKELGGIAREFDIEPNEFVKKVRGKTQVDKDGLINAILEAQGTVDEDEDDDEESPF